MITAWTATGPVGTCDICQKRFSHYEGMANCGICQADHCDACYTAATKRGDCDPDADYDGERWHDLTNWKGCLKCGGKCQACLGKGELEMHEATELDPNTGGAMVPLITCPDCNGTGKSKSSREIEREEHELIANLRMAQS